MAARTIGGITQEGQAAAQKAAEEELQGGTGVNKSFFELPDRLKVPVTIVTGFLGSGKTTLVNHILHLNARNNKRFAVIENEFGDVRTESDLTATKIETAEDLAPLDTGCQCCMSREDIVSSVTKILSAGGANASSGDDGGGNDAAAAGAAGPSFGRIDGILIEATGGANPAFIVQTFYQNEDLRRRCRVDGILCVVDAEKVRTQLEMKFGVASGEDPAASEDEGLLARVANELDANGEAENKDAGSSGAAAALALLGLPGKGQLALTGDGQAGGDEVGREDEGGIDVTKQAAAAKMKMEEKQVGFKVDRSINETMRQIAFADRILLNKVDLLEDSEGEELAEVKKALREVNRLADIVECRHGKADADKLLNLYRFSLSNIVTELVEEEEEVLAPPQDAMGASSLSSGAAGVVSGGGTTSRELLTSDPYIKNGELLKDRTLFHPLIPDVDAGGGAGSGGTKKGDGGSAAPTSNSTGAAVEASSTGVKQVDTAANAGAAAVAALLGQKKQEETPAGATAESGAPLDFDEAGDGGADEPAAKRAKLDAEGGTSSAPPAADTDNSLALVVPTAAAAAASSSALGPERPTAKINSVGIELRPGETIFLSKLEEWISRLLQTRGEQLYRFRGVVAMKGFEEKFVFHGVHMVFDGNFVDKWSIPEHDRVCRLVFVGKNLNREQLLLGFRACIAPTKLRFRIGDDVEAKVRGVWRKGKVTHLWQSHIDPELGCARSFPYRIKLNETGIEIYALYDENTMVRAVRKF
eukprot:g7467.t1